MQFDRCIGSAKNSGFQAVNLAACFGASRIILIGFDMTLAGGSHWHGDHTGGLTNPSKVKIRQWATAMDGAAVDLLHIGVEVLNASPVSSLTAYPKMTLSEAAKCFHLF